MRIWIDGYEANVPQRLGSGQVAFELLKNIEKQDKKNNYVVLLPSEPLADLPNERAGWVYRILRPKQLWTRFALPWHLFRSNPKPDVFFSPTHYSPWVSPVKRVVTIFDLSYLRFPEMFEKKDLYQLTNWTKQSIEKAEQIVTISQSSKKDIVKTYKVDPKKVTVAYPGYNDVQFKKIDNREKINQVIQKYQISGPYILFIGTVQPRKNLKRLIQAFHNVIARSEGRATKQSDKLESTMKPGEDSGQVIDRESPGISEASHNQSGMIVARMTDKTQDKGLKLVVVGKTTGEGRQAWKFEEIVELPKKLEIEDEVIFTGFVPNEDMLYLLNGATAFVLPSLWEGFGIPVVDAMACGVPVIVSNVSSLPEVAGNAGLYVDPNSVDQIEQAIRLISTDKKLHVKMSKLALEQAKKFSWKKMAKQVIEVLEK